MFKTYNPNHISSSPISIDKTGSESATTAVLYILDVFGFCPQMLQGAKLGIFFQCAGTPPKTVATIPSVIKDIEAKAGGKIEKWDVVGMCWGGKVVSYSYGPDGKFSAAAEARPATVDPYNAPNIAVPMYLLTSGDEDAEAIEAF
ncbi:MAG: hypothetical protein ASARMPRED_006685 [Alectoria sarmentosa]|nr:MAG: hypothetical protein ASARMPRED_006685 [Alectoria sarmentosa]